MSGSHATYYFPLGARRLNDWAFCPRLAYLEYVQGEWRDDENTTDGRRIHKRVDREEGAWPLADAIQGREVARSLWLTAEDEGITARVDLVEAGEDGKVRVVDYKRGEVPDVPGNVYEPEQVQLAAQALVLRSHGYQVDEGAIWFAASRRRVNVPITDALVARTRSIVRELNAAVEWGDMPPPLIDSPKCRGCSLAPLCMPDETALLRAEAGDIHAPLEDRLPRRLVPARDDGVSLHVSTPGAYLSVSGEELVAKKGGELLGKQALPLCSAVALYGPVQVSTQAMTRLVGAGIPVTLHSSGGWFLGQIVGMPHGHIALRQRQHAIAADPAAALTLARAFVVAKLRNQRTLLRRGARAAGRRREAAEIDEEKATSREAAAAVAPSAEEDGLPFGGLDLEDVLPPEGEGAAAVDASLGASPDAGDEVPWDGELGAVAEAEARRQEHDAGRALAGGAEIDPRTIDRALRTLAEAARAAAEAPDIATLMGCEGAGAHAYFSCFAALLRPQVRRAGFDFEKRNRRPPADPVNAALSFAYAMLVRELTSIAMRVGLEPMLGFLHQPRHGRPALALDLMEEFRPVLADSAVLMALNNGELRRQHFVMRGPACNLDDEGRKRMILAWERRMDQLVTHPLFGSRVSYRRILEMQTRLLARTLIGDIPKYPAFEVR